MDALEAIKKRKSVRSFSSKKIDKETIDKIMEAGKGAPSAGGLNTQKFFVFTDEKDKESLAQIAYGQEFVAKAPLVVVVAVDEKKSKSRYGNRGEFYSVCDGSAAVQNILLASTAFNLGSCWVGAFDDNALKKFLKTEAKPIAIVPIGYPN